MATQVEEIQHKAFGYLRAFFEDYGFTSYPQLKQFRRPTATGFQNVMVSTSGEGPFTMEFHLGIRSELVEALAYQFLAAPVGFSQHATTVTVPLFRIDDSIPRKFHFHRPNDVDVACSLAIRSLRTHGFDFFADNNSIHALDRMLNAFPEEPSPYLYNQVHRCFRGLVVAKMAQNGAMPYLMETYKHVLEQRAVPERLRVGYERLVVFLHHHSLN